MKVSMKKWIKLSTHVRHQKDLDPPAIMQEHVYEPGVKVNHTHRCFLMRTACDFITRNETHLHAKPLDLVWEKCTFQFLSFVVQIFRSKI